MCRSGNKWGIPYWTVAEICDGDAGQQWVRKAYAVMADMQERGVLPEDDRRDLEHASVLLGVN